MSARCWCGPVTGVACFLLRPSVKLSRWVVGPWPREHEQSRCRRDRETWQHERFGARCSCTMPAPCWVPVRLDDVSAHVRPGETAVVRLAVTNDGATSRNFEIGTNDSHVLVQPSALALGPLEHGISVLSLAVPASASDTYVEQCVVSVRGCKRYSFRWTVRACRGCRHRHDHGARGLLCRHHDPDRALHVAVKDRPDYVHHWYDHFYCERPCPDS